MGTVRASSSQQTVMQSTMMPATTNRIMVRPVLPVAFSTFDGCLKIPLAIVRLSIRHRTENLERSCWSAGEKTSRCRVCQPALCSAAGMNT